MPDLKVVLLSRIVAICLVCIVDYEFVFVDSVPILPPGTLGTCFIRVQIVRHVVVKSHCSQKNVKLFLVPVFR